MDDWYKMPDLKIRGASEFLDHKICKCSIDDLDRLNSTNIFETIVNHFDHRKSEINKAISKMIDFPGVFVLRTAVSVGSYTENYDYVQDNKFYYKIFVKIPKEGILDEVFRTSLNHKQFKQYFDTHSELALTDGNIIGYISRFDVTDLYLANVITEDEYRNAYDLKLKGGD